MSLFFHCLWCRCYIIICNDIFYFDVIIFCHLDCHFYIHVVSGIISKQYCNSFSLISIYDRIIKCQCRGRCKHFTNCDTVKHSVSKITYECGFVSTSSSGYQSNFSFFHLFHGNDMIIFF